MTKHPKLIKGAGGPPAPPPPPYRAPDTLESRTFATVFDLLSEGEIEGFATPSKENITDTSSTAYTNASLKDVFLDNVVVLDSNADNTNPSDSDFNYKDVIFKQKFGQANQTGITGIPNPNETRSPTLVDVDVTNADGTETGGETGSVTRVINTPDVDAVIITLTWPQIQRAKSNGDVVGSTVEYKIQLKYGNGAFVDKIGGSAGEAIVKGRSADAYQRDHRIKLEGVSTTNTASIRVIRVTKDGDQNKGVLDSFKFTSLQEVVDQDSSFPNCAYAVIRVDSKQFSRIPTRKYRIRGIKIRIPGAGANDSGTPTVDPITGRIIYPSGYIFNGVMQNAVWCSCPAMILLDLLTNRRYGLGNHLCPSFNPSNPSDQDIYENLDLFTFFSASKFSNTLVSDETGIAQEARFSCNVNIQSPKEAFDAINELAGVMRCMPIWSAGQIKISQDKPTTASYLFNLANVGEGGFSYSGSSLKQRHSVVSVAYFNMDSTEVDFEVVEDQTAIAKFGTIVKQIKAFGCTSRGQAKRLGKAVLFAEQNESETVTFTTSIDSGVVVRPGMVIEINDPVRAGNRTGGRVVSATKNSVTTDAVAQNTYPSLDHDPKLSVILEDGTVEVGKIGSINNGVINLKNVSDAVTKVNSLGELETQSEFTTAPLSNSPYLISSTNLNTQLFRVIQVEEQDGISYVITALTYVEGKYAFIEEDEALPVRTISTLNVLLKSPSNLSISERVVIINNVARVKVIFNWEPVSGAVSYLLNYKLDDNNFISQIVFTSYFEILDAEPGVYEVQVFTYNAVQRLSAIPSITTETIVGKSALPENVSGIVLTGIDEDLVRIRFKQSVSLDVLHGGRVYVRHSDESINSANFENAQDVIEAVPGNASEVIVPAITGTYILKFQDDGNRFSPQASKVAFEKTIKTNDSILIRQDFEHNDPTPFNGVKINSTVSSNVLKLTDPTVNKDGIYFFQTTLDLDDIYTLKLERLLKTSGFYSGDLFDNRTDNIDTWTDFDGNIAGDVNAKMQVAVTDSNPSTMSGVLYILQGANLIIQKTNHGLAVGDLIFFSPFEGPAVNLSNMNRDFTVESVVDANNFIVLSGHIVNQTTNAANGFLSNKFSQYNDFVLDKVTGRGFRFRVLLSSQDSAQNINLSQVGYKSTMLVRDEISSTVIESGLGAKTVTFTTPFFTGTNLVTNIPKPSVTINAVSDTGFVMAPGDYHELSNITSTGFVVHFKNSSGNNINRKFTYTAVGVGKKS